MLLALLLALPVFGQTRYVIVSARLAEVEQAAQARGGVLQHRLKYIKGSVVTLPDQAAAALQARFGTDAIIEPDYEHSINLQPPTVPVVQGKPGGGGGGTSGQSVPWGIDAVQAPAGWPFYRGAGVLVGVVDTGIQPDHPDLAANVVGGENFVPKGRTVDPARWADDNGHGTHVAGTVAALDNDIGVVGVAPQASLFAAKVLNAQGSGTSSAVADGIIACVVNGAKVINMSIGGPGGTVMHTAVQHAYSQGVILVASAGNNSCSCLNYPASFPEVLRISAIDSDLQFASFSNFKDIDFTAPGVDVLSTYRGGGYKTLSGTSMAAPHVSGVVALMLSAGINEFYAADIGLPVVLQGNGLISAVPVAP